ncbi:MAG: divalent-cation tolerance protein CutA [Pseudomonadota bacterium]
MEPIVFLYVTAPNMGCAEKIADALVGEQLAACVNIHGEMNSVYRWGGKVCRSREIPLIVKTTQIAAAGARERIIAIHPDETPCVAAIPIEAASSSEPFIDWISQSVGS